jgi:hypothetical protein
MGHTGLSYNLPISLIGVYLPVSPVGHTGPAISVGAYRPISPAGRLFLGASVASGTTPFHLKGLAEGSNFTARVSPARAFRPVNSFRACRPGSPVGANRHVSPAGRLFCGASGGFQDMHPGPPQYFCQGDSVCNQEASCMIRWL